MKRQWLPSSLSDTEMAFALRSTTWGVNVGRFAASFLTALLATKFGWRAVPGIYAAIVAAFAIPFQLICTDSPAEWARRAWPSMAAAEQKLLGVDLDAAPAAAPTTAAAAAATARARKFSVCCSTHTSHTRLCFTLPLRLTEGGAAGRTISSWRPRRQSARSPSTRPIT